MQVLRTKHKVKAFSFAAKAPKGCAASITLALSNNTLEVCSCDQLRLSLAPFAPKRSENPFVHQDDYLENPLLEFIWLQHCLLAAQS